MKTPRQLSDKILTQSDLDALMVLRNPTWIFDISERRMWWANPEAVALWNSDSLEALLERDWSQDMSEATAARLDDYLTRFAEGQTVSEQWTFYPKGEGAVTVKSISSGVRIEQGRLAMLFEATPVETREVSAEDLRGIEALRHTSVMITLYDAQGELLFQNPAAIRAFGSAGNFYSHFENDADARKIWKSVAMDGLHSGEYRFQTTEGSVWHGIDVRRTIDPVSANEAILVNQRDIHSMRWSESVLSWNAKILDRIDDSALTSLLQTIVEMTEATEPEILCSILLLEEDGKTLRVEASPSTISQCSDVMDGIEVGPESVSCGIAAHTGQTVIVEDMLADETWGQYRTIIEQTGLRACWSVPIKDIRGQILGTFVAYHRAPLAPTEKHLGLLKMAANLVRLGIERHNEKAALISARQLAEEARDHAETANRAKSEFLSSMSHELRTPMNSILGFSQLLADDPNEPLSSSHQRYIGQVLENGEHLLSLIDQVLDLSRIEAGKLPMHMEDISLAGVVADCVAILRPMAESQDIELIIDGSVAVAPLCRADKMHLHQVLLNLVSNGVKYTSGKGSVSIGVKLKPESFMRINVADTGDGISDDLQAELFEPFSRLGRETSNIQGSGIGLTIAKQLVEMMGGRIGFESKVGQGSTFWIELPIAA